MSIGFGPAHFVFAQANRFHTRIADFGTRFEAVLGVYTEPISAMKIRGKMSPDPHPVFRRRPQKLPARQSQGIPCNWLKLCKSLEEPRKAAKKHIQQPPTGSGHLLFKPQPPLSHSKLETSLLPGKSIHPAPLSQPQALLNLLPVSQPFWLAPGPARARGNLALKLVYFYAQDPLGAR